MYSLPSTSRARQPLADSKNTGVPPTPLNARTVELTPPGITRCARSNASKLFAWDMRWAFSRTIGESLRIARRRPQQRERAFEFGRRVDVAERVRCDVEDHEARVQLRDCGEHRSAGGERRGALAA